MPLTTKIKLIKAFRDASIEKRNEIQEHTPEGYVTKKVPVPTVVPLRVAKDLVERAMALGAQDAIAATENSPAVTGYAQTLSKLEAELYDLQQEVVARGRDQRSHHEELNRLGAMRLAHRDLIDKLEGHAVSQREVIRTLSEKLDRAWDEIDRLKDNDRDDSTIQGAIERRLNDIAELNTSRYDQVQGQIRELCKQLDGVDEITTHQEKDLGDLQNIANLARESRRNLDRRLVALEAGDTVRMNRMMARILDVEGIIKVMQGSIQDHEDKLDALEDWKDRVQGEDY